MASVNLIAFSKDRACQLHAFLTSFRRHVRHSPLPDVVFAATLERFEEGYRRLATMEPDVRLVADGRDFKRSVVELLDPARDYTVFFVDDVVFRRDFRFDDPVLSELARGDVACVSLRLSPRIDTSYMADVESPPPVDGAGTWEWRDQTGDWGYPMSLDGHVFLTSDIAPLIDDIDFDNPNILEAELAWAPIDKPLMACLADHVIFNIPMNRVQTVFPNRHRTDGLTARELNDAFLDGRVIDTVPFDGVANNSVHCELDYRFLDAGAAFD